MVHCHPPIVLSSISELWTHVSALHTLAVLVGVSISDLHDEWTNSIIVLFSFIFNDEPSKDQGMVGESSHLSRPPLGSRVARGVNHEFICCLIVSGSGL